MTTNIQQVLKNALKVLSDNKDACEKDGYHALAADMQDSIREIESVLRDNMMNDSYKEKNHPFVGEGLDGKTYLVFKGYQDPGAFLTNLGFDEYSVPLHHFGGYENAILIDTESRPKNTTYVLDSSNPVKEAGTWLKAISKWLLENDYDMQLPDGVLDTDPLDIAERLHALHPVK